MPSCFAEIGLQNDTGYSTSFGCIVFATHLCPISITIREYQSNMAANNNTTTTNTMFYQGGEESSKANPRPPHRPHGALQETNAYNYNCFMSPNQRWYMLLPWWVCAYQKPKHAVSASGGGLCEWQQKTPPSSNEWFWQMPALFSVLRYISNVSIDILMDNSLKIGV